MNFEEFEKYTEWVKNEPNAQFSQFVNNVIGVIEEWLEYGGLISSVRTKNGVELYTGEAAEADYYFWLNEANEENLTDTISNQKEFCKSALKHANVPDEVIEELLDW